MLIHCPDQKGIVAKVTEFLHWHNGNIINLDQHVDSESKYFFMRVEWDLEGFDYPDKAQLETVFTEQIVSKHEMSFRIHFSEEKLRMAIFVSKATHCLYDILSRSSEWDVEIPLIVSNHPDLESIAKHFDIDFVCLPITPENKLEQEQKQIEILAQYNISFVVLARYMQVVSSSFINHYKNRVINIHHSFLPAFIGSKPYHAAHERGVKIIGATSHFVTEELDAGPIIAQDVTHITHKDSIPDLIRKGKDLEKVVLSRAIWMHIQRRIIVFNNKTIVFE